MPKRTSVSRRSQRFAGEEGKQTREELLLQYRDINKGKARSEFHRRILMLNLLLQSINRISDKLGRIKKDKMLRFVSEYTYTLAQGGKKRTQLSSALTFFTDSPEEVTIPRKTEIRHDHLKQFWEQFHEEFLNLELVYEAKGGRSRKGLGERPSRAPLVHQYGRATQRFVADIGAIADFDLSEDASNGIFADYTLQQFISRELTQAKGVKEPADIRERRRDGSYSRTIPAKKKSEEDTTTSSIGKSFIHPPASIVSYLERTPKYTKEISGVRVNADLRLTTNYGQPMLNDERHTFADIIDRLENEKMYIFDYINSVMKGSRKPSRANISEDIQRIAISTAAEVSRIRDEQERLGQKSARTWSEIERTKMRKGPPRKSDVRNFMSILSVATTILSLDRDAGKIADDELAIVDFKRVRSALKDEVDEPEEESA